jgi:alkanesulfonate monooxygenase SsuD/methylene tetrahydromethanopterin reductase-like flavin-dependent oxidoreductase (luciferase family)
MRVLWDEPTPSFTGEFVSFAGVVQRPRPAQRPHPPIVIGGHAPSALRRAVRSGNGWYGWDLDVEQTATALADLRAAESRHGRPAELGELEITITPPGLPDVATARRYADLGVRRLVLQPHTMAGPAMDELITTAGDTLIGRI